MNYIEHLLGEHEKIVLISRQSWIVLFRDAVVNLFLALIIIGITLVAVPALSLTNPSLGPLGFAALLLLAIPIARFVAQFLKWVNREYIVTNRRVIQIDGVINKNVIDSSLEKVNDVRLSQSVLGRFLNYGDVEILTASELGSNLFHRINDPVGFKTAMLNQKENLGFDDVVRAPGALASPAPVDIPALIASLSAMRSQGLITEDEFQKKKAELLSRM